MILMNCLCAFFVSCKTEIMRFFDITNIMVSLWSYPLSYIEFLGTVFGLLAVWLATRQKLVSWPLGLVNVSCFFVLFYQVQLYSGMLLQAFYFVTNIYGWVIWKRQMNNDEAPIMLTLKTRLIIIMLVAVFTLIMGWMVVHLPESYPQLFHNPASQPYYDAFLAVFSIAGQIMLTRRIVDNWYVWIIVNALSVFVFYRQGLYLLSIEYFVFLLLAVKGVYDWQKTIKKPLVNE